LLVDLDPDQIVERDVKRLRDRAQFVERRAPQEAGADVVPTALRDLFGFRLALRCSTPQASDTILGQGWATAGADASTVPGGQRGVGYLLAEGERPVRVKGFYLDDTDVQAIAERATARRADAWLAEHGAADAVGAVSS
jgi:S-DNA-T family DNA segregation ATPase FtsK/SpoIIIE